MPKILSDKRKRKDASQVWLERTNPLRGLSIREAMNIMDSARSGETQWLHWLFQEIESQNPILLTCVERRAAALAGFAWTIKERYSADRNLAEEQKDAANEFFSDIENLTEAVEHLALAFFRGFSHVQPIWESDGRVKEINLPDSWKFAHREGKWFFTDGTMGGEAIDCEDARLCTIIRRRSVDVPALAVHIRSAIGERDWGRFLERYALPKPQITMPPNVTEGDKATFVQAAQAAENGQSTVWPNGTLISDFAGGARGIDPFNAFIEHQQKLIVLLATGGTLTSLAQADTGSLAGGAQMDVWREIVARDATIIAQAINRDVLRQFLELKFPGKPYCVDFAFDTERKLSAKEIFETAIAARNAGYIIDKVELESQTGYTLKKEEVSSPSPGMLPFANKEKTFLNVAKDVQEPSNKVLEAFARDTSPLADELKKLLENPSKEAADNLLGRLEEFIPEDPALAAIIAEEMAKEFGGVTVETMNSECRAKNPSECSVHGDFSKAPLEKVKAFLDNPPDRMSEKDVDSILTAGFDDIDGDGNIVKYGSLLRDHINRAAHSEKDRIARKKRFGIVVKVVRQSKPKSSNNPNKPYERVYFGSYNGKAYIAVADEHNEIDAIEMVSFRRDSRSDEK